MKTMEVSADLVYKGQVIQGIKFEVDEDVDVLDLMYKLSNSIVVVNNLDKKDRKDNSNSKKDVWIIPDDTDKKPDSSEKAGNDVETENNTQPNTLHNHHEVDLIDVDELALSALDIFWMLPLDSTVVLHIIGESGDVRVGDYVAESLNIMTPVYKVPNWVLRLGVFVSLHNNEGYLDVDIVIPDKYKDIWPIVLSSQLAYVDDIIAQKSFEDEPDKPACSCTHHHRSGYNKVGGTDE